MNEAALSQIYKDLSEKHRNRWTIEQFIRMNDYVVGVEKFDTTYRGTEEHKLPTLEANEFGGLASAVNTVIDTFIPTIIKRGSFKNTLADTEQMSRVKVLFMHDVPIGVPTHMAEVKAGLEVVGKVSETSTGKDALTLLRDGVITEMSIGFTPTQFHFEEKEGEDLRRIVTDLKLFEFSLVDFGANSKAKIQVVNSLLRQRDERYLVEMFEGVVRDIMKSTVSAEIQEPVQVRELQERVSFMANHFRKVYSEEDLSEEEYAALSELHGALGAALATRVGRDSENEAALRVIASTLDEAETYLTSAYSA